MRDFDPENLGQFHMHDEILEKIYELSGGTEESSKGFLLAYVNSEGEPIIHSKAPNQIVHMGLIKAIEQFLIQMESQEDIPPPPEE